FLAVPAAAVAGNEVTKWNEIAVGAIVGSPPAFPTPPALLSAPPASAVFTAMVQGAVYGAVNAADRHGRPYLINRSFPKASAAAAAATAASRVLSALYPGQQGAFDAAYAASLAAIPDQGEEQGKGVGELAAAAMLAEGHNSAIPTGCMFGAGGVGEWQPLTAPGGGAAGGPAAWGGDAEAVLLRSPSPFRA